MKVSIVEDDVLLRQNLKLLLSGETGISVASVYGSAEEALAGVKRARPDILLTDIGLPGMSGIELIRLIKVQMPDLEIMAHTVFDDRETVFAAIKAGASGYILKGSTPRDLIDALHTLERGGSPMSPKIARKVIREFQSEGVDEQYLLSHRETEIVKEVESGLTYKDIATRLGISPHTVHTHIKNIYEKLHAKDRQGALISARKKGII
jgi:DNA-binding NarL/FixJ family response regulator